MIVVAIIALLAAIAVPGFLRARKRSQASRVLNDLRLIDNACDMYAIENNKATGATVNVTRLDELHEKRHQPFRDRQGYSGRIRSPWSRSVDAYSGCSPLRQRTALSDVTDNTFLVALPIRNWFRSSGD